MCCMLKDSYMIKIVDILSGKANLLLNGFEIYWIFSKQLCFFFEPCNRLHYLGVPGSTRTLAQSM